MTNITSIPLASQAEIGWYDLPNEVQIHITSFCDIPDAAAIARTDRHNYAIATNDFVWHAFTRQIGLITHGENTRDQVQSFVADLREAMRENHSPSSLFSKMLIQAPTIDRINRLQKNLKATEILTTWKALAEAIKQPVHELNHLSSSQDIIAQAGKFSTWFAEYQTELSQITRLNLSNNQLTFLHPKIGDLIGLTDLYLCNNNLTSLPREIWNLKQLVQLNLRNNKLSSLPSKIKSLTQLRFLRLEHNKFNTHPSQIKQLPECKVFMEGNPIIPIQSRKRKRTSNNNVN